MLDKDKEQNRATDEAEDLAIALPARVFHKVKKELHNSGYKTGAPDLVGYECT